MNENPETAVLMDDADIEPWWGPDADVTGRLLAAIAVAAAAVPAMNARYDPDRRRFAPLPTVDIGITIETEDGVAIPVLTDVGHRSTVEIRQRLNELRVMVEDCSLHPPIRLVNFGRGPCRYAQLPILPPEIAIVAAGQVLLWPVQVGRHMSQRHCLPLTLTYDARAIGLLAATRFLGAIKTDLAKRDIPLARGWRASLGETP